MKALTYERSNLLNIIKENRDRHEATFTEAFANYRRAVADWHRDQLEILGDADPAEIEVLATSFRMPAPEQHTEDYDRVIRMLELTDQPVISLEQNEFQQYVLDEWNWSGGFLRSTSFYLDGEKI